MYKLFILTGLILLLLAATAYYTEQGAVIYIPAGITGAIFVSIGLGLRGDKP